VIKMLRIASHPGNIRQVESFVRNICAEHSIKEDLYPNILISLTEAVNNAIVHGNNQDENKFVKVEMDCQAERLFLRISDEGRGFDPEHIKDPTAEENVCRIGGRGVFLIKELSDHVCFHNNGSTVQIEFQLSRG